MSRKRPHSDQSSLATSESEDTDDSLSNKKSKACWDAYCWLCHKVNTKRRCITCIRSYHIECISTKEAAQPKSSFRCELCNRMEAAEEDYTERNVNMEQFHKMLEYVTQRLQEDDHFKKFSAGLDFSQLREPKTGPALINPFDLGIIMEKIEDLKYKTTLDFVSDIRWIRHNAEILLNESDIRLEMARYMEDLCDTEMYDIEMCSECFCRVNTMKNWFTEVCSPPHLVVWARMHGHPYWPAKVIGCDGTNKIDVRFFGSHERQNIPVSDCLLFTEENPNKRELYERNKEDIDAAVKEAEIYIEKIEEKYNCVVERPRQFAFSVQQIGKHLTQMFPNLKLPKGFKLKKKPNFLKKYRPRKGPRPSKPRQKRSKTTTNKKVVKIKDCVVRLENCEELIAKLTKDQDMENKENSYEPIVEGGKDGSKTAESTTVSSEAIEIDHVDFEPNLFEEDELQEDKFEENELDELEEDDLGDDKDELEQMLRRAEEHMNRYDLVINLTDSDSGGSFICFNISSDSSDDEMEIEPSVVESPKPTLPVASVSVNERAVEIPANEEELLTCRKDPVPRTYEKMYRRMTISGPENMELIRNQPPFIARKSYGILHTLNLAIHKENAKVDKQGNEAPIHNSELNVYQSFDALEPHNAHNPQNIPNKIRFPNLFEDLDDVGIYSDFSSSFDPEPPSPEFDAVKPSQAEEEQTCATNEATGGSELKSKTDSGVASEPNNGPKDEKNAEQTTNDEQTEEEVSTINADDTQPQETIILQANDRNDDQSKKRIDTVKGQTVSTKPENSDVETPETEIQALIVNTAADTAAGNADERELNQNTSPQCSLLTPPINGNDKMEQSTNDPHTNEATTPMTNQTVECTHNAGSVQLSEMLPIVNSTAETITEIPIEQELKETALPQNPSPAVASTPVVETEASTVNMIIPSVVQPIGETLQTLTKKLSFKETLNQLQRVELIEKDKAIHALQAQLSEIQSQLIQSKEEIQTLKQDRDQAVDQKGRLEQELHQLKTNHEEQLQKAIEDIKSKEWCVICKKGAQPMKVKTPPFCSRECIEKYLLINKESSNATVQNVTQTNEPVLPAEHTVETPILNGHLESNPSSVDDYSFSEIAGY